MPYKLFCKHLLPNLHYELLLSFPFRTGDALHLLMYMSEKYSKVQASCLKLQHCHSSEKNKQLLNKLCILVQKNCLCLLVIE